jgi:hypothetical protein
MAPFLNGDLDLQDAAEACEVRSCHRSANEHEPPSCWNQCSRTRKRRSDPIGDPVGPSAIDTGRETRSKLSNFSSGYSASRRKSRSLLSLAAVIGKV